MAPKIDGGIDEKLCLMKPKTHCGLAAVIVNFKNFLF